MKRIIMIQKYVLPIFLKLNSVSFYLNQEAVIYAKGQSAGNSGRYLLV